MTWYVVTANGVRFLICADTLDDAIRGASVHLAALGGCRIIESVREIA